MGYFLLGFAVGVAIGAAAVIFTAPRSGSTLRHGISETVQGALDAARQAGVAHEQELWSEFHKRLKAES